MRPYFERSGFVHSRYDNAEVVNNGFLVRVQYTSMSSLVIALIRNELFFHLIHTDA